MSTDIERLLAVEEIKQLKARYLRAVDTKDWDLLAQVFAPDAVSGPNERGDVTEGREKIVDRLRGALGAVTTVSHAHSPEIDITSPSAATGVWVQEDQLWGFPAGTSGTMHGYGHYHDTYVRTADGWRIAATRLTRLRVETTDA